jgi:hypothetical protein
MCNIPSIGFSCTRGSIRQTPTSPNSKITRLATDLGIPDLRFIVMPKHPHLIFYLDTPTHIDVLRVLDSRREFDGLL